MKIGFLLMYCNRELKIISKVNKKLYIIKKEIKD